MSNQMNANVMQMPKNVLCSQAQIEHFFSGLITKRSFLYKTRRLKSFPWDALVYGRIMVFYMNLEKLGKPERCVML